MKIGRIGLKLKQKTITLSYKAAKEYFGSNNKTISLSLLIILLEKWAYGLIYRLLIPNPKKSQTKTPLSGTSKKHPLLNFDDIRPTESFFNSSIELNIAENPTVCILINAVNCPEKYLRNCLAAIGRKMALTTYEIIVLTDVIYSLPHRIKQVLFVNPYPINKLAEETQAPYVFFMNAYLQSVNDFLTPCLQITDNYSSLTSKIIYENSGLLKYAGGKMEKDSSLGFSGVYNNPNDFEFNYITSVDFAAETLFTKTENLNGVNLTIEPNSWTNTLIKLSLNIREKLDKPIYYHPLSCFISYQEEVPKIDIQAELPTLYSSINKSILVIDAVYPTPDKDSGSRRIFELMKIFSSLNLRIYFVAHEAVTTEKYYDALINLGVRVFKGAYYREKQFSKLGKYLSEIDFAWISRPDMNEIYGPYVKQRNNNIKWIYDTVDLHFIREQRAKEVNSNISLVIDKNIEKLKEKELKLANLADYTITVTDVEKDILTGYGIQKVYTVPNVHPVQHIPSESLSFNEREGIIFIGSYLHQPNIDAAFWLIKEIMPIVWQTLPNLKVFLLGSNPSNDIIDLASNSVIVPGYIEDVSPYFLNSRLFVAPLRFGAGMKGKIGQSLEFGLPVVSTHIGVEGMNLEDEDNCLIANDTALFAEKIIHLYSNSELWIKIHENSLKAIAQYSPASVTKQLKTIFAI